MATLLISLLLVFSSLGVDASRFTLQNKCATTIWPGILSGAGRPQLMNGGFSLAPNQVIDVDAPTGWSGRFWARTGCSFDQSGKGTCSTGDCGGVLACAGAGGVPPVSLAEFTLDSPQDFYDVSLVDGYNLPVSINPWGGPGNCNATSCLSDLNQRCPLNLQVKDKGQIVACKSACMAFNRPKYCCTGTYGSPQTCKRTHYSKLFKKSCPTAYSYAYDDATSTFTCQGGNYLIKFC